LFISDTHTNGLGNLIRQVKMGETVGAILNFLRGFTIPITENQNLIGQANAIESKFVGYYGNGRSFSFWPQVTFKRTVFRNLLQEIDNGLEIFRIPD
jgi:hypothetical protein